MRVQVVPANYRSGIRNKVPESEFKLILNSKANSPSGDLIVKVHIVPHNVIAHCSRGEILAEVIKRVIPEFPTPCGGRGFCGKCIVKVIKGKLSEPTGNELLHELPKGTRLACQARVLSDLIIEVPAIGEFKALTSGLEPRISEIDPLLKITTIKVSEPTLEYPIPYDRMVVKLSKSKGLKLRALKKMSEGNLKNGEELKILLRNDAIVNIADPRGKVLGLAVDIGTTKIAAYLIDLESGDNLAEGYMLNPQSKYGDDVISRITHVMRYPNTLHEMHEVTINVIEKLGEKLCQKLGVRMSDIYAMCLVGNTVMISILLEVDPSPIGKAPFAPYCSVPLEGYGSELGFKSLGDAWFYIPPSITGFVGADAIADILTAEALGVTPPSMLLDIGTNTEIALLMRDRIAITSAPAGPALEGANISCGIKSLEGAIYRVKVNEEGKVIEYKVYGDNPIGLSGSGVISLVAELLRHGLLNRDGKLSADLGGSFEVIPNKIVMTQRDIREVQKAKAAISSGWRILLEVTGVTAEELRNVFICGSFGSNIEPKDALTLGLIPKVPLSRVIILGNSAGTGARLMLKSEKAREIAERIVERAIFVEQALHPKFMNIWLNSLTFGY